VHASALETGVKEPDLVTGQTTLRFEFPRKCRLNHSKDYRRVFADGIGVASQHFVLLGRRNNGEKPRLGLAVAKKHLKRATDRNLAKRIVRESFRLHQNTLSGIDIVAMVKRGTQSRDQKALKCDLDALWLRLNRKCGKLLQA
jgi:ribonuclease P protein component